MARRLFVWFLFPFLTSHHRNAFVFMGISLPPSTTTTIPCFYILFITDHLCPPHDHGPLCKHAHSSSGSSTSSTSTSSSTSASSTSTSASGSSSSSSSSSGGNNNNYNVNANEYDAQGGYSEGYGYADSGNRDGAATRTQSATRKSTVWMAAVAGAAVTAMIFGAIMWKRKVRFHRARLHHLFLLHMV